MAFKDAPKRADIHIHLIGGEEDGCYISKSLTERLWSRFLAPWISPAGRTARGYVDRLAAYIRESPIETGVILACDAAYDSRGERDPDTEFYVPNDYVFRVARQHRQLLPGVSIHPSRRDALEELERCLGLGAVLVKWIPNSQNVDPSDRQYAPFYRRLADSGMPLLSHIGHEFTFRSRNQNLGDPKRLRLPLEEGVTVIAAHCGISYGGLSIRYLKDWLEMIRRYPNLYGDLAAYSFGFAAMRLKRLLRDGVAVTRLVNGSDFPVPPLRGLQDLLRRNNPIARDYEIKTKLGVPESVFHRGYQLLRL